MTLLYNCILCPKSFSDNDAFYCHIQVKWSRPEKTREILCILYIHVIWRIFSFLYRPSIIWRGKITKTSMDAAKWNRLPLNAKFAVASSSMTATLFTLIWRMCMASIGPCTWTEFEECAEEKLPKNCPVSHVWFLTVFEITHQVSFYIEGVFVIQKRARRNLNVTVINVLASFANMRFSW